MLPGITWQVDLTGVEVGRLRALGADGVYAAGDLARLSASDGAGHRVEHWNQAVDQGRHVAATVLHDLGLGEDPGVLEVVPTYSARLANALTPAVHAREALDVALAAPDRG